MNAVARAALVLIASCVFAAACLKSGRTEPADYVAMGSSFAAGPGVGDRVQTAPFLCARSNGNYAQLLAASLHYRLLDVSCSGAVTDNILRRPMAGQPPQIASLSPATKLVTITVGGNDLNYLGGLAARSCENAPDRVPLLWRPIVCKSPSSLGAAIDAPTLRRRLIDVLVAIKTRAPHAQIILVDYLTLFQPADRCWTRAPLNPSDVTVAAKTGEVLSEASREAAAASGVGFLPASALSAKHGVCWPAPWVFGFQFPPTPFQWGSAAYHPNSEGMKAVAAAAEALVRASQAPTPTQSERP